MPLAGIPIQRSLPGTVPHGANVSPTNENCPATQNAMRGSQFELRRKLIN
ncbi:hypothetical protein RBSWK_04386 [Rhodopirellula baltica SWK14]|uniref:Uncharacterized protein n=1 Tax=Rhodopirellula baltica SWK14 TaxID=993516 RepID=L7CDF4_RHOBT|nr:hypothetical protein RBSWK_04386 [Rhodopirellula baltica SWK14]